MATKTAFKAAYAALNPRQRRAVDAIEGPVMVLAGPGTGKTQVLAVRVANILQQTQMDPWNILCLTFTESGVVAMRERLTAIIGPSAYRVHVATFHSFCNDLIQEFPEKFALASEWQVLADIECLEVWRGILDALPSHNPLKPFGNPYLFLSEISDRVRKLKQEDIAPARLAAQLDQLEELLQALTSPLQDFFAMKPKARSEEACDQLREHMLAQSERLTMSPSWLGFLSGLFDRDLVEQTARTKLKNDIKQWFERSRRHLPRQRALGQVYEGYQRELKRRGRYDYEDMIVAVVQRLKTDADLLAYCQEQFQYVLVDEYQDTNSAQNEFLQLLGSFSEKPNIFVVGDDKQSIFRFQGASLENLRFFYELFRKDIVVIALQDNYRSQLVILEAAGELISHNRESVEKYIPKISGKLTARSGREERLISARAYGSQAAERFAVATQVQQLLAQGVAPQAIAILFRYNRDAAAMAAAMAALNIPIRIEADEDVLDDVAVHQLVQLLTYLAGEATDQREGRVDELLAEILQYQFWGFEPLAVAKLLHKAGQRRTQLWPLMTETPAFAELAQKIAQWRVALHNHPLQRWVDIVLDESGYMAWWLAQGEQAATVGKLSRFLQEMQRANFANHALTPQGFLKQIEVLAQHGLGLLVSSAAHAGADGRVRLSTAHKAKGLEFEHVFLIHVADRHWGNMPGREKLPLPHGLLKYDSILEEASDEDERRLFYVAVTRAKQGLHLSYAHRADNGREQVPAVFWHEIPSTLRQEEEVLEVDGAGVERLRTVVRRPLLEQGDGPMKEWLAKELKHYTMSVTHLNHYLECPRLFYYRDLLRLPMAKTKHQAFGVAIHAALRDFFREYGLHGELPGEQLLLERFARHLKREVLTARQEADSLALGQEILQKYYARYHDQFRHENLLEYNFAGHGILLKDLRLTGKLDKVEILDAKKKLVNVVDYKTGNPDNGAKEARKGGKYYRQLVFYKLLTELSPRFEYEMVSGEIDFIESSKRTGKLLKKKFEISAADIKDLKETITRVWQEVQELKFLNSGTACGECQYCLQFK